MDAFLLDTVCNNLLKNKRLKPKSQLELLKSLFNGGYLNIREDNIIRRIREINENIRQLNILKSIPLIEQRSEDWYNLRKTLITASDFAQALGKGKFGTKKQFLKKKCGYENETLDMNIPPLQWGVRYEEVANMFYKTKMNVDVFEFGILRHPEISYLGASPDGISELGIMLEIKCPWRRKKTETVPEQYYYQIQGQLDVCRLNECDYLECFICEYESYEDMVNSNLFYKGIILLCDEKYVYGSINDLEFGFEKEYSKIYYYGIKDHYLRRIKRDDEFILDMNNNLSLMWKLVLQYRENRELYDKDVQTNKTKKITKCMFRDINNVGETI